MRWVWRKNMLCFFNLIPLFKHPQHCCNSRCVRILNILLIYEPHDRRNIRIRNENMFVIKRIPIWCFTITVILVFNSDTPSSSNTPALYLDMKVVHT